MTNMLDLDTAAYSAASGSAGDDERSASVICTIVVAALLALSIAFAFCGCKSYYENAGARVRGGSLIAPIDISEPSSLVNIRALYSMDGFDAYAAKDYTLEVNYTNTYTNSYFGMVDRSGVQRVEAKIKPVEPNGE